jgi:hypothetical protein
MFPSKLLLAFALYSITACNSRNSANDYKDRVLIGKQFPGEAQVKRIEKQVIDTSFRRKQTVFKEWLTDTLKVLSPSVVKFNSKSKDIKKEFKATEDSLGLSVVNAYDLSPVTSQNTKMRDVKALLEVLKRSGEYPKTDFSLKFKTLYFFTPSPVPDLDYDITFDLSDVQVIEEDGTKISHYEIVRGRISDKHITTLESGRMQETRVSFTWEGGKLKKEVLAATYRSDNR